MSENVVGIVVGVTVGIVAAQIGNQAYLKLKEDVHKDELAAERHEGFRDGFNAANSNPENIRKRFKELFGTNGKEEGKASTARE